MAGDRRDFLKLLGATAGLVGSATTADKAPTDDEMAAFRRLDEWITLSHKQEALQGTPRWDEFVAKYPTAGVIGTAVFEDLLATVRYAIRK